MKTSEAVNAITEARGNMTRAARLLGVSRQTVYNMAAKHASIQAAITEARESRKDHAEDRLQELMDEGNVAAVIFYLKTQARDRGYIERHETEQSGTVELIVRREDRGPAGAGD